MSTNASTKIRPWRLFALVAMFCLGTLRLEGHGETQIQIAALTKRIAAATDNTAPLYLQRGELYREHQDWVAAEADYAQAAKLDPGLVAVDLCRAGMLADAGQLEAAQALFDQVIIRSPNYGEAFLGRARLLVKRGKQQASVPDFLRALDLLKFPEPDHFLETAQALMSQGKRDEALATLDVGIRKGGPIPSLQTYAIDLELERRMPDAALARLDTIIDLAPRKESWLAKRGDILLEAGRLTEAEKAYRNALKSIDLLPRRLQISPSMVDLQTRVQASLTKCAPPGARVTSE